MHIIFRFLEKFLTWFNPKKNNPGDDQLIKQNSTKIIGSLEFRLDSNKDIDISFGFPKELQDKTPEQIALLGEMYSELLVAVTCGDLNEFIYNGLNKNLQADNDTNHILLVNNILLFWSMIYKDKIKKRTKKYDQYQPLIRPSQAFAPR